MQRFDDSNLMIPNGLRRTGIILNLLYRYTFFIAIFQSSVLFAAENPAEGMLSVAQVETDVGLAREAYARVHPGYDRYTPEGELELAWQAIIDRARRDNGLNLGDLYLEVEKVLTLIRCDHTKAELPRSLEQYRQSHPVYLPFLWEVIEGRGFITAVQPDSPLRVGDEILAIEGTSLTELIDSVAPYIPVDGYTEWAKRGGISQSLEFMGGAVDHFGSLLWPIEKTFELTLVGTDGQSRVEQANRVNYKSYQEIAQSQVSTRNFKDAITFERIGDNSAYLRIDTFVNYRDPVDPDTLYRPIFTQLKEEKRNQLILDLRNNGGGSTDAERRLLAHLIDRPVKTTNEMRVATLELDGLKEHLSTWEQSALNPNRLLFRKNKDKTYSLRSWFAPELRKIKPAKNAFNGNLIILTSSNNSSASTNLIAVLKSHANVLTIGEKTGGSPEGTNAGIILTLTLPESNIRTRIPVFRFYNNTEGFESGQGLIPDILIQRTAEAFQQNRDEALERAKELTSSGWVAD